MTTEQKIVAALMFYGDRGSWAIGECSGFQAQYDPPHTKIQDDRGKVAQEVLGEMAWDEKWQPLIMATKENQ